MKLCLTTIRGQTADTFNCAEGLTRGAAKYPGKMTQTTFTIAALFVGFTIAALIVLSAVTMGAIAGA